VVSNRSIRRYRWRGPSRPSSQTWRTFLRNHAHHLWAADLFTVQTLTFKMLYVLVCALSHVSGFLSEKGGVGGKITLEFNGSPGGET
jgi:hypothetical protein